MIAPFARASKVAQRLSVLDGPGKIKIAARSDRANYPIHPKTKMSDKLIPSLVVMKLFRA
jgi:hypothetical protein